MSLTVRDSPPLRLWRVGANGRLIHPADLTQSNDPLLFMSETTAREWLRVAQTMAAEEATVWKSSPSEDTALYALLPVS